MNDKPTEELDKILENMKPSKLNGFINDNSDSMVNAEKAFYYYMKDKYLEKKIKLKDVYLLAGVSESYGGKILRMEQKHSDDRDLIIRFCLVGRFNRIETNRALTLYGMSSLYAKNPRDACIIVAINNRIFDLYEIDKILEEKGFNKITSDKEQ